MEVNPHMKIITNIPEVKAILKEPPRPPKYCPFCLKRCRYRGHRHGPRRIEHLFLCRRCGRHFLLQSKTADVPPARLGKYMEVRSESL